MSPFKIVLLAMGAVLGYGSAFHQMRHHHSDRSDWEQHVADLCVHAADHRHGDPPARSTDKPKTETNEP